MKSVFGSKATVALHYHPDNIPGKITGKMKPGGWEGVCWLAFILISKYFYWVFYISRKTRSESLFIHHNPSSLWFCFIWIMLIDYKGRMNFVLPYFPCLLYTLLFRIHHFLIFAYNHAVPILLFHEEIKVQ